MRHITLLTCILLASGCSSIVDDDQQIMTVETEPEGARCFLENERGKFVVNKTPGNVTIQTACSELKITCSKDGYKTTSSGMEDTHKGIVWGNIIFGGIIGYAVDYSSGAACEYPTSVSIILEEK